MCKSVAGALAVEIIVAAVKRVKVDAAEAFRAAVAELSRPLSATIARGHVLVERAETTSLNLFTRLRLQTFMGTVLRIVTFEWRWVVRRALMSCRSSMSGCIVRTGVMLGMGMGVVFGLRLGFHVDSSGRNSRPVIVRF